MTNSPAVRRARAAACTLAVVLFTSCALFAQNDAADTKALIEALGLAPGQVVAEIGAGDGDLTVAIARHLGPTGRMLTTELGTDRVARLRDAVRRSGAGTVEVLDGHATQANLPDACCDAIFMRNVYHHFEDPALMNASLLRALKPGGRLAIIDFPPRGSAAAAPPAERAGSAHGVTVAALTSELEKAGFRVESNVERSNRWFLVVASKPAS